MGRSWWRVLTKYDPLEKGMTNQYSCLEYEKAKREDTERGTPQVGRCPICYWITEIPPERMERQSQSKNTTQLWM